MQHRRWVALSYLLAFAALGMLAFLAAPHPTALAAHSGKNVHMSKATLIKGATKLAMRGRHGPLRSRDGHFANPFGRTEAQDVQRRQSLLYDSVTVGPYGSYDAQTYYFGANGVQQEGDGTMYQPEIVYDSLAPEGERLVPWRWNEVEYQDGPDMGNLAAPPPKNPLVPWTWDDVIYQTPEQAGAE